MSIRSFLIQNYAHWRVAYLQKQSLKAQENQLLILKNIVKKAAKTKFGLAHQFNNIKNYSDFKKQVPVRDYEQLSSYFEATRSGEADVLWPGKPKYLATTSGTTSGVKFIPITNDSVGNHFFSAQDALMHFIHQTHQGQLVDGKMIFLSGSPQLKNINGIKTGRLSGIVNHEIPAYLKRNQVPSWTTNCMEDWEAKIYEIAKETYHEDIRLISGIPPWIQMYFNTLQSLHGRKKIIDIFPNLKIVVHGGVQFSPYRQKLENSIGKSLPTLETYPASEGFFAYQNDYLKEDLLLNTHSGIFFEFIPMTEISSSNPIRLCLSEVSTQVNYALVLSSNAGLWSYLIGDTVKFTQLHPPKIKVTGRIKHFISAFGEHVIAEEIEEALNFACQQMPCEIIEFTVAPRFLEKPELPFHEWLIAFDKKPDDLIKFAKILDTFLQNKNIYYKDLIIGKVLQSLQITVLKPDAFIIYMKSIGKLGGQNKVPRLSNDRVLADALLKLNQ